MAREHLGAEDFVDYSSDAYKSGVVAATVFESAVTGTGYLRRRTLAKILKNGLSKQQINILRKQGLKDGVIRRLESTQNGAKQIEILKREGIQRAKILEYGKKWKEVARDNNAIGHHIQQAKGHPIDIKAPFFNGRKQKPWFPHAMGAADPKNIVVFKNRKSLFKELTSKVQHERAHLTSIHKETVDKFRTYSQPARVAVQLGRAYTEKNRQGLSYNSAIKSNVGDLNSGKYVRIQKGSLLDPDNKNGFGRPSSTFGNCSDPFRIQRTQRNISDPFRIQRTQRNIPEGFVIRNNGRPQLQKPDHFGYIYDRTAGMHIKRRR
ncbi:MAG TPA: hypothetical protein VFV86_11280 [Nitrososphaeraceae archaeon]|nr:hypothetical protein [Nitrososphaeraceae archaeon]